MEAVKVIPEVTEAEWEVMRVVWAQSEVTSKQVCDVLENKRNWKAATTKTLLGRLVEKGALTFKKEGKKFIYSSGVDEEATVQVEIDQLLNKVCSKHRGELVAKMLEEIPVTNQDLNLLQRIIDKKRQTAVASIPCTCIPGQCSCRHKIHGGEVK